MYVHNMICHMKSSALSKIYFIIPKFDNYLYYIYIYIYIYELHIHYKYLTQMLQIYVEYTACHIYILHIWYMYITYVYQYITYHVYICVCTCMYIYISQQTRTRVCQTEVHPGKRFPGWWHSTLIFWHWSPMMAKALFPTNSLLKMKYLLSFWTMPVQQYIHLSYTAKNKQ